MTSIQIHHCERCRSTPCWTTKRPIQARPGPGTTGLLNKQSRNRPAPRLEKKVTKWDSQCRTLGPSLVKRKRASRSPAGGKRAHNTHRARRISRARCFRVRRRLSNAFHRITLPPLKEPQMADSEQGNCCLPCPASAVASPSS